jgi:hypothetical protein
MVTVVVIGEGPTEEQFLKQVVAPAFRARQIFIKPLLLQTSKGHKGGGLNIDRVTDNAIKILRADGRVILSTFFDLYGLAADFPGIQAAQSLPDVYQRVRHLEQALHQAVIAKVQCQPQRFLPHIQPHEFEALLFADVAALCKAEPGWEKSLGALEKVRATHDTPEHINDGYETAPSKRLLGLLEPQYKKTRHGPLAAQKITLDVIERECPHFKSWMDALRKLDTQQTGAI